MFTLTKFQNVNTVICQCVYEIYPVVVTCVQSWNYLKKSKKPLPVCQGTLQRKRKLKTKILAITNLFALHANVVRQPYKQNENQTIKIQKQPPEVFCKKLFSKISKNSQKSTCARVSFFNKIVFLIKPQGCTAFFL